METGGRGKRGKFSRTVVNVACGLNLRPGRGVPVNTTSDIASETISSDEFKDNLIAEINEQEIGNDATISVPTTTENNSESETVHSGKFRDDPASEINEGQKVDEATILKPTSDGASAVKSRELRDNLIAEINEKRSRYVTISIPTTSDSEGEIFNDNSNQNIAGAMDREEPQASHANKTGEKSGNISLKNKHDNISKDAGGTTKAKQNTTSSSDDSENIPLTTNVKKPFKIKDKNTASRRFVKQFIGKKQPTTQNNNEDKVKIRKDDKINDGASGVNRRGFRDNLVAQINEKRSKDFTILIPTTSESEGESYNDNPNQNIAGAMDTEDQLANRSDKASGSDNSKIKHNVPQYDGRTTKTKRNATSSSDDSEHIPLTTNIKKAFQIKDKDIASRRFVRHSIGKKQPTTENLNEDKFKIRKDDKVNEGACTSKGILPKRRKTNLSPKQSKASNLTKNEGSPAKTRKRCRCKHAIKTNESRNGQVTTDSGKERARIRCIRKTVSKRQNNAKKSDSDSDSDDVRKYTIKDFHDTCTKNTWGGRLRRFWKWQPNYNLLWIWFLSQFLNRFKPPGFKEAIKKGTHIFMRFYWVIGTLLLLCYGTYWVIKDANDNHRFPTLFTLYRKEIDTGNIPFYSQTICSTCAFKTSALNLAKTIHVGASVFGSYNNDGVEWNEDEAAELLFLIHQRCSDRNSAESYFCKKEPSYAEEIETLRNITMINDPRSITSKKILEFLEMGQPQVDDVFVYCAINGKQVKCKDVISKTQTEYGTCFTFNKIPDELKYSDVDTYKFEMDKRSITSSELEDWKKYNLDELDFETGVFKGMNTNSTTIKFQKTAGVNQGFSYVLANPLECACRQSDGIGWMVVSHMPTEEPNMSKGSLISPNTVVHLGVIPTITMGQPDIKDLSIEKRECVYSGEVQLQYFGIYTESNCFEECAINAILDKCGCVEFFRAGPSGKPLCKPSQQECIREAIEKLRSKPRMESCPECLPDCNRIILRTESSLMPIDPDNLILKQITEMNRNCSIVHSGYVVSFVAANSRQLKMTFTEKVAQIGGTLGLTNNITIIDFLRFLHALGWLLLALWQRKIFYKLFWSIVNLMKRNWRFFKKMAGYEIKEDPKHGQGANDNPDPRADLPIELDSDASRAESEEEHCDCDCKNVTGELLQRMKMLENKLRERNRGLRGETRQQTPTPQPPETEHESINSDEDPAANLIDISVAQVEPVFQQWNQAREERRLRDEEAARILAPPLIPLPIINPPRGRINQIMERFAQRREELNQRIQQTRRNRVAAVPEGTFKRQGAMRRPKNARGQIRTHLFMQRFPQEENPTT